MKLPPDLQRLTMMRAIRDGGYRCQRVDNAGYQEEYRNMRMWVALCGVEIQDLRRLPGRQWRRAGPQLRGRRPAVAAALRRPAPGCPAERESVQGRRRGQGLPQPI
jgi:hypothetical protein